MTTMVKDLTVDEFKKIIKTTVETTLREKSKEYIAEVSDKEQQELEEMFGKKPKKEDTSSYKELDV